MAGAGNIEAPKSSSTTLSTTARKYWPKRFKINLFLKQKEEILRGFFKIFIRKTFVIFRNVLRISGKILI